MLWRAERDSARIVVIQSGFAYFIARKLAFTEPFLIAKLLANPSSDFLRHTVDPQPQRASNSRSVTDWVLPVDRGLVPHQPCFGVLTSIFFRFQNEILEFPVRFLQSFASLGDLLLSTAAICQG